MAIHTLLAFLIWHVYLHGFILAQPGGLAYTQCGVSGNYTEISTYKKNLNSLLSSLASHMDKYGFYNASIGQNNDMVSAIVLCRGDEEVQVCRTCVRNVSQNLVQSCPNQKEAFGGYEECLLWYSDQSITGTMSTFAPFYYSSIYDAFGGEEFNQALFKLLDSLQGPASNGDPRRKYATGNVTGPDFQTIYALVQCIPNLSPQQCSDCLTKAYGEMVNCTCNGTKGGRIIMSGCNFRYETYRFFNGMVFEAPPPGKDDKKAQTGKDHKTARTVIIVIVTIAIFIVCISIILMKRRKRKPVNKIQSMRVDDISTAESLQYDFSTIRVATDNFSNDNKLGQGGFGPVYKGKLPNGREIAVKRLSANSEQGDVEFKNEVLLVARLQHRNLVRLLGFCLDGTERLLVYEFVPNASLDHFLFDLIKRRELDWEKRFKIIGGIARGILYLHEDSRLRIIHRDLKASNVLLDEEMNPKISDFGSARLVVLDETHGSTNRIAGTYGYMAPEYAMHGKFSVKSDVFSFGVLVLEILSGQRNTCFRNGEFVGNLLSYAWMNWREETTSKLIDPILMGSSGLVSDIVRCIHIALLCVQENVTDRPTMAAVVLMLSSLSLSLPVPSRPALSDVNLETSLIQEYNSQNEASITELYPR
ncbi:cysteine-rich receptor-like protein kinase 44 [Lycium ferocissimum]|uniref:cysteine-rich receptor-like protein kinase 44 n=1 Tax=Lycium ferocissimum TaxID=112874 RepID=UPI002816749A|nr:cysteine-rich receptor-like protein kinase 44 [Lycium ferocissimum]